MTLRVLVLMLGALLVGAPSLAAPDDVCTCRNDTFLWTAIGTTIPADAWDCSDPGGDDTPGADDSFEPGDGCVVGCTGALTFSGTATQTHIRLLSGSTWSAGPACDLSALPAGSTHATGIGAQTELFAFIQEPGATIISEGEFAQFYLSSRSATTTIDDDSLLRIGDVVPCIDGDCTTDADTIRLSFPVAKYDPHDGLNAGDNFLGESLGDLDADMVAIFTQLDPTLSYLSADAFAMYEVDAVSAAGDPYTIDLNLDQGTRDNGYPLARRRVAEFDLRLAVGVGERILESDANVFTSNPDPCNAGDVRDCPGGVFESRWLSCGPSDRPYLISSSFDDGGGVGFDQFEIADLRGVREAFAAGTTCYVHYGWQEGDAVAFLDPVRWGSATAADGDSGLLFKGVVDRFSGNVLEDIREITVYGASAQLTDNVRHNWMRDARWDDSEGRHILFSEVSLPSVLRNWQFTGGHETAANDGNYIAIVNETGAGFDLKMRFNRWRHNGDDAFTPVAGVTNLGQALLEYNVGQFIGETADSGNFYNEDNLGTPPPLKVTLRHNICGDCSTHEDIGTALSKVPQIPSADCLVEDFMMIGGNGLAATNGAAGGVAGCRFRDLAVIGGGMPYNSSGTLVPTNVKGAEIREKAHLDAGPFTITEAAQLVEDALIFDIQARAGSGDHATIVWGDSTTGVPNGLTIKNSVICDVGYEDLGSISVQGWAQQKSTSSPNPTFERVLFCRTAASTVLDEGNDHFVHMQNASVIPIMNGVAMVGSTGDCGSRWRIDPDRLADGHRHVLLRQPRGHDHELHSHGEQHDRDDRRRDLPRVRVLPRRDLRARGDEGRAWCRGEVPADDRSAGSRHPRHPVDLPNGAHGAGHSRGRRGRRWRIGRREEALGPCPASSTTGAPRSSCVRTCASRAPSPGRTSARTSTTSSGAWGRLPRTWPTSRRRRSPSGVAPSSDR